jgi:hypothetical protein
MNQLYLDTVTYLIGAAVILAALLIACIFLVLCLKYGIEIILRKALRLYRISTIVYWLRRMEKDGLLAPMQAYRQMVKDRTPKTQEEYHEVDRDSQK